MDYHPTQGGVEIFLVAPWAIKFGRKLNEHIQPLFTSLVDKFLSITHLI